MEAAETANPQDTEFLREAVRLAELRLDDQVATNASLERKAVVFTTSSIAVLGYVFVNKPVEFVPANLILIILILLPIAISVILGVISTLPFEFGALGQNPKKSWKASPNTAKLMVDYLVVCQKRIKIGDRMLKRKSIALTVCIWAFYCGISSLFIGIAYPIVKVLLQ